MHLICRQAEQLPPILDVEERRFFAHRSRLLIQDPLHVRRPIQADAFADGSLD